MNKQPTDTDGIRRLHHAPRGILKQRTSKTSAMKRLENGKASQHDNWNWLRHIATKPARGYLRMNRAGCKRIISNNLSILANNKRARGATHLVGQRATFQPVIQ